MLKFAWKHMRVHWGRLLLVGLSIVLTASVGLLAANISNQVREGIVNTAAYYDLIIGPAGSATQLAMNSMFFTDEPLGTISYEYVEEIEKSGLTNAVIPFTMGDSYNGARIVGTTSAFLNGKNLRTGDMFSEEFEAVVGFAVAQSYGISVGDSLVTSHGLTESGSEHAATPLTVTGILQKTGTAYDNVIFTSYETVWAVHGSHDEHEEEHEDDEHDEHHHEEGEICAILIRSKSFNDYYKLLEYYGGDANLLCINPATVLREVLNQVDLSAQIVYVLCGIILLMNLVVISVITLLNMYDAKKEISMMRLIGIGMGRIAKLYTLENAIAGLISTALALLFAHVCLGWMGSYVASMGIVLDTGRIYGVEYAILAVVFVISVLPTVLKIAHMARREGIGA